MAVICTIFLVGCNNDKVNNNENGQNESLYGYYELYTVKSKSNDTTEYFAYRTVRDGLCYEADTIYQIEKVGSSLTMKELIAYSCDSEEEERLRAMANSEDDLYDAHRLKYEIEGSRVTKEEYDTKLNELKEKYEIIEQREACFGS